MNVAKLERLNPDDLGLFLKAAKLAFEVAEAEKVMLKLVQPKFRLDGCSCLGHCDFNKKEITILIRNRNLKCDGHQWFKTPLKWKDINDTVLHEVAHLMYPDHSKQFRNYETYLIKYYSIN